MKPRCALKDEVYWRNQVAFFQKSARRFEKMGRDEPDRELRLRGLRLGWARRLDLVRAQYSAGAPISKLAATFVELVAALEAFLAEPDHEQEYPYDLSDIDDYVTLMALLSLGILFGASREQLETVLKLGGKPGQDALYDAIAAWAIPGRSARAKLLHPTPYALLHRALNVDDSDDAGTDMVEFLQKYYAGIKKVYFYDTHLKPEAGFAGYWSFESAVVVVVRDIDDSGFADNLYYPADLAQYARTRRKK